MNRRSFLALSAGGIFYTQRGAFAQALTLTPAQTEGPYYPNRLPLDQDNDLLVINDGITPAVGTIAWISGRILDRNGSPLRAAVMEIWQADNQGNYIHTNGANAGTVRDANFQGYGKFVTASNGEYLFRTIKPGLYPGRVRHVHVKVTLPGGRSLTTQLYIEGETGANDGVLNGVPQAQRAAVVRPWTTVANSAVGALATTFDIVMDYTPSETPAPTRPTIVSMAGITHGATLAPGAAASSWVTIFGDGLASTSRTWRESDFVNGQPPTALDGVSVRIGNQNAAVYYISPKQINVLAPASAPTGSLPVTVTSGSASSDSINVDMRQHAPGFFQFPSEYVAAVRSDGALLGPANLISGAVTVPALPGDAVLLFGTGFGATDSPVKIHIHDTSVPVAFAGIVSPGLHQVNITVPDLPDGDYPVTAEVGGVRTAKFARIRIQRTATRASVRNTAKPEIAFCHPSVLATIRKLQYTLA
jgi:protocatechuate 3,4-dioxygenase beta subunit